MSSLLDKFICPQCKHTGRIELVETNVILGSIIQAIHEDNHISYDDPEILDGITDRYQCDNCGWVISEASGEEELIEYLKGL